MPASDLRTVIDSLWERRDTLNAQTEGEAREAIERALTALDEGRLRVAEPERRAGLYMNGSRKRFFFLSALLTAVWRNVAVVVFPVLTRCH